MFDTEFSAELSEAELSSDLTDVADVADHIVAEWASENAGVAEVIPVGEIERHLDDVVREPDSFSDDEWRDLVVEAKDAIMEQDVVIV